MNGAEKAYIKLSDNIYAVSGAINTGILVHNNRAVLIDCCDSMSMKKISCLGVDKVDMILFTQHRRTHTAGAYRFAEMGARFIASYKDRHLFEDAETYWERPENRWHIYHSQPGSLVMVKSLPLYDTVRDGDVIKWERFCIKILETPGATDGSISFAVEEGGKIICFSGDVIYGRGKIYELYSLQKGFTTTDYHGFIGNIKNLVPSMKKLELLNANILVPSHGHIINNPSESINAAIDLLGKLYKNYFSITSINYYFPKFFTDAYAGFEKMEPAICIDLPEFIKFVEFTSFVLVSKTGSALLIDCGDDKVIDILKNWISEGKIKFIDACWITHYHDDHVDAVNKLLLEFNCPVVTTDIVAEVIKQPSCYFLPCISPCSIPVEKVISNGYVWEWNEFKITAFDFPGQTLYHSGLLVEAYDKKLFFAGDSFSPNGIDDYCCGNRNFIGKDKGYRYCIDILRRYKPDYIINQHQTKAFKFSDIQLDYIELKLIEREEILKRISPWNDPSFSTDEWWVRTFPYEQETFAGGIITVEVHFTNHDIKPIKAYVQPMLPEKWELQNEADIQEIVVPAKTFGSPGKKFENPDGKVVFIIKLPENIPEKRYVITYRITWDGRYLGQFRHSFVIVKKFKSNAF